MKPIFQQNTATPSIPIQSLQLNVDSENIDCAEDIPSSSHEITPHTNSTYSLSASSTSSSHKHKEKKKDKKEKKHKDKKKHKKSKKHKKHKSMDKMLPEIDLGLNEASQGLSSGSSTPSPPTSPKA